EAALDTLTSLPEAKLVGAISQETHPKILELLVENRSGDQGLLERVLSIRAINDRTACLVALHARGAVIDAVVANQERLLSTPKMYLQLLENPDATERQNERVNSFLRLHGSLPELPRPKEPEPVEAEPEAPAAPLQVSASQLEAEIEAALAGHASTVTQPVELEPVKLEMFDLDDIDLDEEEGLGDFEFGFEDEQKDFTWDMLEESDKDEDDELNDSLEQRVRNMTVGQKIKLAYVGNVSVRRLLIRDSNKLVAAAIVKSGRMTENEVLKAAGNANLGSDILRELSTNKSALRKYPIKVALASNPKTPIPVTLSLIPHLQKGDLKNLANSRSVSAVVFQAALRLYRQKFERG
ncbi:MAG: hypothetical protein VX519_03960, partial [Myxococcota bacterium]|nr:hypothetical protein [Myxococcota bacterium]